ncbi:hypothetical protein V493_00548, partial [Pseudogymnoascus sp. VKM F-4281 (FW-2241)]
MAGIASSRLLGAVAAFALFTHYSILRVGSLLPHPSSKACESAQPRLQCTVSTQSPPAAKDGQWEGTGSNPSCRLSCPPSPEFPDPRQINWRVLERRAPLTQANHDPSGPASPARTRTRKLGTSPEPDLILCGRPCGPAVVPSR